MMWSEAKLSARDQLTDEQVILKLLVDRRFHHLANDAQQLGNWPVLSRIRLGISLMNWDDQRQSSIGLGKYLLKSRVERDGIMD